MLSYRLDGEEEGKKMKEIKHATIEAGYINDLQTKLLVSWSLYLIYTQKGDEIAAACNITAARACASALSFIQMPCSRSALEVSMNDPRFMEVVEHLLKDESFRAYHQYRRVTK